MKELGAVAIEEHRALGSALQASSVALFVGCGGLAALTAEAAKGLGIRSFNAENAAAAAEWLLNEVRDGDVILVKASRSVGAEVVVEALARALGTEPKGSLA
jgi:UDP-N-acetylmuramoyl-tripeptide--D-alanyl-D-alanine ligase